MIYLFKMVMFYSFFVCLPEGIISLTIIITITVLSIIHHPLTTTVFSPWSSIIPSIFPWKFLILPLKMVIFHRFLMVFGCLPEVKWIQNTPLEGAPASLKATSPGQMKPQPRTPGGLGSLGSGGPEKWRNLDKKKWEIVGLYTNYSMGFHTFLHV